MKNDHILLKNIGLLLFGTIMGLAITEAALRIIGYSAPVFREPDAKLGWRGTSNLEGLHRIENVTYNRFNSKGYHDRERSKAKLHGTIRIAIVGDSFVQSSEVSLDEHFATIMEKKINERLSPINRNVEIINFGISGFSTAQELILLRNEIREYRPDLVILLVYPGNDIMDNSYELTATLRDMRPYFVKNKNRSLSLKPGYPDQDKIFIDSILVKIINRSRLLQLSKEAGKRWSLSKIAESEQAENKKKPEDDVFLDQHSGLWADAWDITETLIHEFEKETVAFGADFLMVITAIPIQVHPLETERIQFMNSLNLKRLDYPDSRLAEFAERYNIPYISLVKPFFDYSRTGGYLFGFDKNSFGKGHWNATGHHLVADLLTKKVMGNIKSDRPEKYKASLKNLYRLKND
ncbi:MAG: SGNH/GDSL hydrolase family protein [Desulfobacteraceae bacterium]|jgi:hypothetical protein